MKRTKISEYIIDETLIKVGSEYTWLWAAIEPENRQILALSISKEKNMFVAERFLSGLIRILVGKYTIYIQLSEYNILVFILPLNRQLYFTIIKKISYPNVNAKA